VHNIKVEINVLLCSTSDLHAIIIITCCQRMILSNIKQFIHLQQQIKKHAILRIQYNLLKNINTTTCSLCITLHKDFKQHVNMKFIKYIYNYFIKYML